MNLTLLGVVQQVCDELAISSPSGVAGSPDRKVKQLYALLNRLGSDLSRQYEWQALNLEHILRTVAITTTGNTVNGSNGITGIPSTAGVTTQFSVYGPGAVPFAKVVGVGANSVTLDMPMEATANGVELTFSQVSYNLPDDWLRQVPQTEWDRTNRWPLMGPATAQGWQSFKSGVVYSGPRQRFRIVNNAIELSPPPPNGLLLSFEYISKGWVTSATGQRQTKYINDTDTAIFPDSLLITGLKAQWKAAKGLDGTFDLAEFRSLLDLCQAQDKSAPVLCLSGGGSSRLLSTDNIPDGNWPGN